MCVYVFVCVGGFVRVCACARVCVCACAHIGEGMLVLCIYCERSFHECCDVRRIFVVTVTCLSRSCLSERFDHNDFHDIV